MANLPAIKCFLLDMDGTFYLGNNLIPGAAELLQLLEKTGRDYIFLTNNSSKNSGDYSRKLAEMGIDVSPRKIVTSGEVTANYIKNNWQKPVVYLVGTEKLKQDFIEQGLTVTENKEDNPDVLVLGFDTTLNYKKLWDAHDLILSGIAYLATNPDLVCPLENGATMPDCGAMIKLLETSTGKRPQVIGKPNTLMIDYIYRKTNADKEEMALTGDRLYTDIKTANNAGINSILVLSGETRQQDLEDSNIQPDLVFTSLQEIFQTLK